jgi:guanylate kinase
MSEKLLGNLAEGIVFVVSAPAGTGKTTLVRMLTEEFGAVVESVSCTTRAPRAEEVAGKDYHFLTQEEFKKRIQDNDFLEYAEVFGNWYGTSRQYVKEKQSLGKHVVLVIDTQGAMKLKEQGFSAVFVFLSPPSIEELKQRLVNRKTEDEETLKRRLSWAGEEMKLACRYDYMIVNRDLKIAYGVLRSILIAEEHKTRIKTH